MDSKTNVLDAIYHLSYGVKIRFATSKHVRDFFVIMLEFIKKNRIIQVV
jgi:recombinational DNA repair ATPase RecF